MDRGYKLENAVPNSQIRAQTLQTLQNPETDVASSIPSGDTETLEDP